MQGIFQEAEHQTAPDARQAKYRRLSLQLRSQPVAIAAQVAADISSIEVTTSLMVLQAVLQPALARQLVAHAHQATEILSPRSLTIVVPVQMPSRLLEAVLSSILTV